MSAWVAGAVVVAGVAGAAISANAAGKAAHAQEQASQNATQEQQRQFDVTQANLKPFRDAGLSVLPELTSGTAPGGEFNRNFTMADFNADPGYQFRMDQGQQGLERSAAARGGLLNGGTLKALTQYGQNFASNEYSNAYNRFNNDQSQRFNRLSALAGTGQQATNTTAQIGQTTANNISSNIIGAGNAQAAGYIGQANAINSGISSLGQFYQQQQYANQFNNYSTPSVYANTAGGTVSSSGAIDNGSYNMGGYTANYPSYGGP